MVGAQAAHDETTLTMPHYWCFRQKYSFTDTNQLLTNGLQLSVVTLCLTTLLCSVVPSLTCPSSNTHCNIAGDLSFDLSDNIDSIAA